MSAIVLGPGAGERHAAGAASEVVIKATGEDTAGSFFLSEVVIEPGFPGPPLHRHQALHDMFYVLGGALTLRLDGETVQAGPGTFVCVPPGTAHAFSNTGTAPVRFLNLNTPSGWEHYMRDLGEAARRGPLTSATIGRVASRHDFHLVSGDGHPDPHPST